MTRISPMRPEPTTMIVYDEATGMIHHVAKNVLAAAYEVGQAVMEGTPLGALDQEYVDTSGPEPVIAPRPTLPDLVPSPGAVWTATGGPAGMELAVWDGDLGTLLAEIPETGGSITVTLPDPGPYRFVLTAPFPYLARTMEVQVY